MKSSTYLVSYLICPSSSPSPSSRFFKYTYRGRFTLCAKKEPPETFLQANCAMVRVHPSLSMLNVPVDCFKPASNPVPRPGPAIPISRPAPSSSFPPSRMEQATAESSCKRHTGDYVGSHSSLLLSKCRPAAKNITMRFHAQPGHPPSFQRSTGVKSWHQVWK